MERAPKLIAPVTKCFTISSTGSTLSIEIRILAETEEVADEDRLLLIVNEMCIFLEEIIIALAGCELQGGDSLWVPCVLDTVLAIVELSHAWQEVELLGLECLVVQADGITGDGLESDTADGAHLSSEIVLQEALAQTDALEDLSHHGSFGW